MELNFRLYIDESGDHSYGKKELRKSQVATPEGSLDIDIEHYPHLEQDAKRYLGLTGCIIEKDKYRSIFHQNFEALKQKHFPHNPDSPVIFHRDDIINKRKSFWRLRYPENETAFNKDFLCFINSMEYIVITVVIDKKAHIERYRESAFHPYHYCLAAMLERYCGFLNFIHAKGDIMAESRGGKEDNQLKEAYKHIYNNGTLFRPSNFFSNMLTSKEIKLKPKSANIAGLQLSDLLAHPSKQEILIDNKLIIEREELIFRKEICNLLQSKYNRNYYTGEIMGYGKVLIK